MEGGRGQASDRAEFAFFLVSLDTLRNIRAMRIRSLFLKTGFSLTLVLFMLGSGRPPADPAAVKTPQLPKTVNVKDFARAYGFTEVQVGKDKILLKGHVHELLFFKDSRRAELNGTVIWLNDPMVVQNRRWVLSLVDVQLTLRPLLLPTDVLKGLGHQIVVLDAGHGGADSGAVSPGLLMEKQVVLDITRRVRALLLAQGYQVLLTRHDDRFLELTERSRRADQWNADVFVSIHANSGSATAVGTETFALSLPGYPSTNQAAGSTIPRESYPANAFNQGNVALAYAIHHALIQQNDLTDRGLRRARFAVLKNAPCPAALVEVGFLTHAKEGPKLANAEYRTAMALSIATGIDNYLRAVKKAAINLETETKD
jgi:N-acetylmuramoyl-L-alanine amidase